MYAYRGAEKAAALHKCNGSMKDVLYEDLYNVHMLSDQLKPKPSKDIINMLHTLCLPYSVQNGLTVAEMQWVNGGCTM